MERNSRNTIREVPLPFSEGLMSARLWKANGRTVVGVPELGLYCYGQSESEASFRLFTALLKYYRQLAAHKNRISKKGLEHLDLLKLWVEAIENRMKAPSESNVVALRR